MSIYLCLRNDTLTRPVCNFCLTQMNKIDKKKQCNAFVKSNNQQCSKTPLLFTNYCWWHYPKKALILEFFLVIILTLIFNEPLTYLVSQIPFLYYVDREKPRIERISPEIDKISYIEGKIDHFEVFCSDKYSGINAAKSNIEIQFKTRDGYRRLEGQLNKSGSMFSFKPKKELKYGEYLFEVLVTDKANNENKQVIPFIMKPKNELSVTVISDDFINSPYKDMFKDFIENKKSLLEFNPPQYIYQLSIGNNFNNSAYLKDLYFTIDTSGGIFLAWEELGHIEANGIETINLPEALDKRIQEGRVYLSQKFIHIDKIAPGGLVRFIILIGGMPPSMPRKNDVWEGLQLNGTYLSEGYGRSERRDIKFLIHKSEFKSSKPKH